MTLWICIRSNPCSFGSQWWRVLGLLSPEWSNEFPASSCPLGPLAQVLNSGLHFTKFVASRSQVPAGHLPMGFGLRTEFCFSVQSEDRGCVMCSSDQTTYQGYNVYVYSIHLLVRSCVEVPLECCISYLCPFRLALWPATTASCSIELAGVKRYAKQLQREATSFGKGLYWDMHVASKAYWKHQPEK